MKLKIKDSKYFSELGGWKSLATAIFAVILLGKGEEKGGGKGREEKGS